MNIVDVKKSDNNVFFMINCVRKCSERGENQSATETISVRE